MILAYHLPRCLFAKETSVFSETHTTNCWVLGYFYTSKHLVDVDNLSIFKQHITVVYLGRVRWDNIGAISSRTWGRRFRPGKQRFLGRNLVRWRDNGRLRSLDVAVRRCWWTACVYPPTYSRHCRVTTKAFRYNTSIVSIAILTCTDGITIFPACTEAPACRPLSAGRRGGVLGGHLDSCRLWHCKRLILIGGGGGLGNVIGHGDSFGVLVACRRLLNDSCHSWS